MSTQAAQRLEDVFQAPLAGLNLIEASAGTGKTYTITGLYLRLVLEAGLRVDRILVVTYTNAATKELRDRIRQLLARAREAFERSESEDLLCRGLLERLPDPESAKRRLTRAMQGFDQAAIFTIHGFCQRVLAESAFESGMPFETEVIPDEREILQEIVDDFWRREFYSASPLLVGHLLDEGWSPEGLLEAVRPHVGKPYLKVLGPEEEPDLATAEAAFTGAYRRARALWGPAREPVMDLLGTHPGLNRQRYRSGSIPGWIGRMSDCLAPEMPSLGLFDKFEKFTARHLAESMKKGHEAPGHPFFTACDALADANQALAEAYASYLRVLKVRLLAYCNEELAVRKRRLQVQSYDDLLINLHRALQGARGERLAETVRSRYSAALIDEFQDTDPVQYAIFRRLYGEAGAPAFLVGDPKQAIYSFRGADIFAYLQARRDATQPVYTLDVNWRSHPDLIAALNALYEKARRPFLFQDIPFQQALPADREREPFAVDGDDGAPLRVWLLGRDESGKPAGKGRTTELAARATAAEVARLLNRAARGEARIGERPLDGGDVAVLVRSHRQGWRVRDELLRLGVPSVQQAQDNVFESPEARELERVLMAAAEPAREHLVRAALATELMGATGEEIYRLSENERAWEERLEAFHDYYRLWAEHGFIRMFRAWLSGEDVARRLLGFSDGERRLTNLLHLAELLQAEASHSRLGMEGLVKWLSEMREARGPQDEERQLRLESDEHLVKIVTVHKSKGLEYPVVFCPFLWDGNIRAEKAESFAFHDPGDEDRPALDMGSTRQEEHRPQACDEELAESLRLLYVALTRAKHRCYLVWGAIHQADTSAPAWLLHQPPALAADAELVAATAERFRGLDDAGLRSELERVAAKAGGAIYVEDLPEAPGERYRPPRAEEPCFAARRFPGPVPGGWRIASYTALTGGHGGELPDYDATVSQEEGETSEAEERRSVLTFPRGARAGSCLHAILEYLDFAQRDRVAADALVERCLAAHGFETEWTPVVGDMVERALATPLDEASGLRLGGVSRDRRLNELEFYYPLAGLTAAGLRAVLAAHVPAGSPLREALEGLAFAEARGYMKGYIDLVFEAGGRYYVADYKSNWLGPTAEAYRAERLPPVMARERYYLQYLVYSVAVHRYLRLRLPDYDYDRHFGGVFYLFLRGMDPALGPGYGIFRDRPTRGLIEALDAYIASGEAI